MLFTDMKVGDHISVGCSRSKLFWWMNSDTFDGTIRDIDEENKYIRLEVRTEPRPSRIQTHDFWLNVTSPDVTWIEKRL